MSSVKEKPMKRKLFGSSEQDEKIDSNASAAEKKRRRKNAIETAKHYPKSERQQLAMVMQMTSMGNSPEPASPPPSTTRKTPGGSGRKDKIHKRNIRGETALHLCTIRGDLDAMKELIKRGADVNVQDFAGWTPLHEACNHGHQEITRYLLEVGANVNSKGLDNDTPLHDAVTNSHRDLVELLLKHGANPLLKNKRGERPLDIAEDRTIRDLMQKEVIPSDEDESESEQDCLSPSRSEDSLESHRNVAKFRTTSTSSSNQELFRSGKKKMRHKQKIISEKPKSFSPLTSDTSSDSDSSDDTSSSVQKKDGEIPRSNGYRDGNTGKTPVLSGAPQKTLKLKQKRKTEDDSSRSLQKVKIQTHKPAFAADLISSGDASSDSSDHIMQRKDENGTNLNDSFKKNSLVRSDKKDYTKSLYTTHEKIRLSEKKPVPHLGELSLKKKQTHLDQVKRARSHSNEEGGAVLKVKSYEKVKSLPESGTTVPKVNGFQNSVGSPSHRKTERADESVYDFSLSTEDFTDTSAISLKQKFKDKASELFDVLCLGKTSQNLESDVKTELTSHQSEPVTPKPVRRTSKDKQPTLGKVSVKEGMPSTIHSEVGEEVVTLDRNHNKIATDAFDNRPVKKQMQNSPPQLPDTQSFNHVPHKPVEHKTAVVLDRPPALKEPPTLDFNSNFHKEDSKGEKKVKKPHTPSMSPPKKPSHNSVATVVIKSDGALKKESVKTEQMLDSKPEKQKKAIFEGEPKTPSGAEKTHSGGGPLKKKKKHKHKHSHDTPSSEHKHRQRVASSEHSASEKEKSASSQGKLLLKKSDSAKSLHGVSSRKNSLDGKAESGAIAGVRKKVRSTDSTSSETSVKSVKQLTPASKLAKPLSSGGSLDKQATPTSVKKDKSEPKKIALISDANSFFLSELEKSSKQRELEKKLKLKRKKKLQQQRLKAQNAVEMALKDAKLNMPISEKSMSTLPEKIIYDSFEPMSVDGTKQPMRVPIHGGLYPEIPSNPFDPNYPYRTNFGTSHPDNTNSVDRPGFCPGVFKSPPLAGRSISQVDNRGLYPPQLPENWNRGERPYAPPQEKKHLPVQRSLSFSAQSTDGTTPGRLLPYPDIQGAAYHEGLQHRHSISEVPHSPRLTPNYSPSRAQQPHPVNGPPLPPNTASYVPRHPVAVTPQICQSPNILTPAGENVNHISPTSNAPSSTTPVTVTEPVVPAPANDAPNNGPADISHQSKPPDVKPKEGEDAGGKLNRTQDSKPEDDNKENLKEEEEKKVSESEENKTEKLENAVDNEEVERKIALENYVKERLSKLEAVIEAPEPKRLPVFIPIEKLQKTAEKDPMQDRLNVYEEWAFIQKQINERRKKYYAAVVIPQAPHCYYEYLTYTGAYLLGGSRESWLSVPVLAPPPSLNEDMHALFAAHENERVKLRLQHATQREKLIVACEQEIMRVHSRAARMLQNQQIPLSACSILLDREIYNLERRNKKVQDENGNGRSSSIRDRFNGRMLLSWLQDVDDKYVKMKNVLLARQRHESQALHAVQRTEWFLKFQEVENQGQQKRWTHSKPEDVSELYVPLVNISDDFDLLPG